MSHVIYRVREEMRAVWSRLEQGVAVTRAGDGFALEHARILAKDVQHLQNLPTYAFPGAGIRASGIGMI